MRCLVILLAEYIEKNLNGQIPSDYRQGGVIGGTDWFRVDMGCFLNVH